MNTVGPGEPEMPAEAAKIPSRLRRGAPMGPTGSRVFDLASPAGDDPLKTHEGFQNPVKYCLPTAHRGAKSPLTNLTQTQFAWNRAASSE